MMKIAAVCFIAAALLTGSFARVSAAQSDMHPLNVLSCNPQHNSYVSGPAYMPAYYPPMGRYGWYDVYGYRYYQPPVVQTNPVLAIDYVNQTQRVMKEIEFGLIANERLVAEVKDVGTFSPGVEIKHEFGISENVFPLQTGLARCVPLRITFADGTKWRNPRLPQRPRRQMYETPGPGR